MNFIPKKCVSLVVFFFIFAIAAFGQISNGRHEVWKPVEVNGERITITNAFIDFAPGDRRFTGSTGCNVMTGTVTAGRGRRIDIGAAATTRRACKMMEGSVPEGIFLKALDTAVRYRRNGDTLDLLDRRGRRLIRFTLSPKTVQADETSGNDLTAKKWFLESVGSRMTLVAIKGLFLNFDAQKKSAGGNSGCNVFGGSYLTEGRKIAIRDIFSTMRACDEDGKMQIEREFLDGLRTADSYKISDDHLYLYAGKRLLLTFRGETK